jgi:hypothetical protein
MGWMIFDAFIIYERRKAEASQAARVRKWGSIQSFLKTGAMKKEI